jgi:hypothetical protein
MKCSVRELSQKVGKVEEVELCAYGSGCTGEKISDCRECRTAMKRCRMTVTNTDTVAGTWIADAVFFYKTASFVKTPESATIEPGKSYTFDFYQMYTLDPRPTSATCALTIASRGTIETCYMETTIIENCEDVTKIEMVKSEICG